MMAVGKEDVMWRRIAVMVVILSLWGRVALAEVDVDSGLPGIRAGDLDECVADV